MDIVIDANIVFAMLIRSGITERILLSDKIHCYAPEYLFLEVAEHKEYILKLTKRSNEDFQRFMDVLQRKIELIPVSEFDQYISEAESLLPDKDDAAYLAVCLATKMPLWSNDDHFAKQKSVKVFITQELIRFLEIE